MTRGFVTIATGDEQYYRIAANLLRSYRFFSASPMPFALICDRENEYSAEFDHTIILKDPVFPIWTNSDYLNVFLMMKQFLLIPTAWHIVI